jgi:hypothetical protein
MTRKYQGTSQRARTRLLRAVLSGSMAGMATQAAASDLCVACLGPDTTYACAVENASLANDDPRLRLYCITELAKLEDIQVARSTAQKHHHAQVNAKCSLHLQDLISPRPPLQQRPHSHLREQRQHLLPVRRRSVVLRRRLFLRPLNKRPWYANQRHLRKQFRKWSRKVPPRLKRRLMTPAKGPQTQQNRPAQQLKMPVRRLVTPPRKPGRA